MEGIIWVQDNSHGIGYDGIIDQTCESGRSDVEYSRMAA